MNEIERQLETFKKKIENANDLVSELESIRHDTSKYERLVKSFEDHMIDYQKGAEDITKSLNQLNENSSELINKIVSIVTSLSSLSNQSKEYVNLVENLISNNKRKIDDIGLKTKQIIDEQHSNSRSQKSINYVVITLLGFALAIQGLVLYWILFNI